MRLILIILTLFITVNAQGEIIWKAETFPNPFSDDFQKCNIERKMNFCDPENILSKTAQRNIMNELSKLQQITFNEEASVFCDRQGLIGGLAIANIFSGGYSWTLRGHAKQLLREWKMDERCQKSFIILIAIKDESYWIAKDSNVQIHSDHFIELFNNQKERFRDGNFETAIINVIRGISSNAENSRGYSLMNIFWIILVIVFPTSIIIILACMKFCSCGGGGGYSSARNNGAGDDYCSGGGNTEGGGGGDW